jgi:hypothetical protein
VEQIWKYINAKYKPKEVVLISAIHYKLTNEYIGDGLCGLVVRISGYRFRGPGSIPGYQIFWEVVGLERGPLSLVSTTEGLLDRKSSDSGPEIQ